MTEITIQTKKETENKQIQYGNRCLEKRELFFDPNGCFGCLRYLRKETKKLLSK